VHAKQLEWIGRLAADLPNESLRLRATTGLANALWPMDRSMEFLRLPPGPARERTLASLRARLDDPSQPVREEAWSVLLRCGDPEAFDRALLALGESERSLQLLVQPLRDCLRREAEAGGSALIERALARLEELLAEREAEPLAGRRLRLLQTLALVPDARSAERLLGLARSSDTTIEGLRAHEWLLIQASNSGPAGRTRLHAALFEESDPIRRLDLIWVLGSVPDEASRVRLLELLDDERFSQAERLYAAQQLCQMGPTERVASAIKRLAPRFDNQARRGLQCLLWRWY
jgi:HEAT repeat protein